MLMQRPGRAVRPRSGRVALRSGRVAPRIGWGAAASVPLVFLTVFFLWPVLSLIAMGIVRGGTLDLSAVPEMFGASRTWRVIGQTLAQATGSTVVSVALGLPAAFVLYRLRFRGRSALRAVMTVPFVLPTVVVGVAFTALVGPGGPLAWTGLDRSFAVIVAAMAFFNVTVVARTVGSFWARLDESTEMAARVLGASRTRAWLMATLPALAPAIASAASLVFLFSATAFAIVLVLGGRQFSNVETEIYRLTMQFLDLRGAAVLSLAQFVIVGFSLMLSARVRRAGERAVMLREDTDRARAPQIRDLPAIAVFIATVAVLHLLPIVTLVMRSLRGDDGRWGFHNYVALAIPPDAFPIDESVVSALWLSVRIATVAAGISMVLGVLIALVLSRRPRSVVLQRGQGAFDSLIMLPLGVSAVTLGFGLLVTMHQPLGLGFDLRTSVVLIPIAQALVALPIVVRTLLPVLRGIDPALHDAAAVLGAGQWATLRTIDAPLLGRTLGLALGFSFAVSLGEFGASSFLVRPGAQTLPIVVAELIEHQAPGSYGAGLAAAVVLGAATTAAMLIAERLRGSSASGARGGALAAGAAGL